MAIKNFVPYAKLKLFKWEFQLTDPHPNTNTFLKSIEPESKVSQMQMYESGLDSVI
jgi:hypothetical protein